MREISFITLFVVKRKYNKRENSLNLIGSKNAILSKYSAEKNSESQKKYSTNAN